MQMQTVYRRSLACVAGLAIVLFSGWAAADPPSRVARLGYLAGAVSFSPAGENDWVRATLNRPLGPGDRLWTDTGHGARAEIQIGGAIIRMDAGTSLSVLNLDDSIAQLQLTQGTLNVRVRHLEPNQVFEVDTPNLAFTVRQPGEYRIDVEPQGDATTIIVRQGKGEAYGEDAAYVIDARQPYRFTGTGLRDYELVGVPRLDEFDRWAGSRDRSYENSRSARYVSSDVVGYQDLDDHGTWRVDASYGNVWVPNRVAVGWAPYSDGHWAWVDPWGWTWIDDAPWGFAVSHYGRWANLRGTWGWVPGPVRSRAYYAPALVAFVGGNNFQLSISSGRVGGVAWFPLAPREVYRPSYPVSRRYFENINHSNTVVNNVVINQQYNNINVTNVTYANQQVSGAIVAVPATAFVQSQPVAKAAQRVSRENLVGQAVMVVPAVAPSEKSVRGAAAIGDAPPPRVFERPVVARTAIPAAPAGFAAQREQLTAQPGRPLDTASRKELKPAAAVPAPIVKVLAPRVEGQPSLPPPVVKPDERRTQPEASKESTVPQGKNLSPAAPLAPVTQVPDSRGRPAQDIGRDAREPALTPAPDKPAVATPPDGSLRPGTLQEPAVKSPEGRGKPAQARGRDAREPALTPAPDKPAVATPPDGSPRPGALQEPAVKAPEGPGKPAQGRGRDAREPALTPAPDKPAVATPPDGSPRPGTLQEPAVKSPEGRGKMEQDRNRVPNGQRDVPEPEKPVVAMPPPISPRPAPPREPAVKTPEARGRSEQGANRDRRGQEALKPPSDKPPAATLPGVFPGIPAPP
jgi:hypothetical protein